MMHHRSSLLLFAVLVGAGALAQSHDLSVGVSGNYAPALGAGVGALLDYQHPLGAHLDLTAQLRSSYFTGIGHTGYTDGPVLHNPAYSFLGAGLDFRVPDTGFRFGLLSGAVHAPYFDPLAQQRYALAPGAVFSLGYQFNARLALALENMVYLAPGNAQGPGRSRQMPTLRPKVRAGEG